MRVYLDTVGCRLNQSEIEAYARQFRAAGHTLVAESSQADMIVINTCAVTAAASADSRQKVRQMGRTGASRVVVTGCWSTLNPAEAAGLEGVSQVVSNLDKDNLVAEVLRIPAETFEREFIEREPLPGARMRTRAFIKVQDGCNNRCTFCVTTLARGASRSRTSQAVLQDVQAALGGGVQEIVLTGVHLGSWGQDFDPPVRLSRLIKTLLDETHTPRLRLSSLEPWDLDANFFELWQNPRLCRHLHLPLQSGCGSTLRRMARKTTPASFAGLVAAARRAIPQVAITTDVIVGFPGEDEAEFAESLDFIRRMDFAGGHVFSYSARPGTAAARMLNQVAPAVRKERSAQIRAVFDEAAARYQEQFLGQDREVLWESTDSYGPDGWRLSGLTDNYLRVHTHSPQPLWNQVTLVHLSTLTMEGLSGELVHV